MTHRLPVLFLGHGAPMNATRASPFTAALQALAPDLADARGALFVSAHWETDGVEVLAAPRLAKLNDFFGHHPDLEALSYDAPGSPALAARVQDLLGAEVAVRADPERGLDHGVWSVACHLFPARATPFSQVSLARTLTSADHLALARRLRPLRDEGILLVASGNVCHDVRAIHPQPDREPHAAHVTFDRAVAEAVARRDLDALVAYEALPGSRQAAPTREHYLPLLYALGASGEDDPLHALYEGFEHGAMSLRSYRWG